MTAFRRDSGDEGNTVFQMAQRRGLMGFEYLIGAAVLLLLAWWSVVQVRTGHVGVLTRFGRVTGVVLPSGIHVINPLDKKTDIEVRTQTLKETATVPSVEGLIMTLDTSLIFNLNPDKAAELYRDLGLNYVERIVEPSLRSAIRAATGAHTANALYTGARVEVAKQIEEDLGKALAPRGITVQEVLLRDVQLPPTLKTSIEAKQRAEQEALQMSFVLQKEKQEAERKRIEAQGIADFQRIVAQGISPQLLTWKGIEATEKLATSANAKVIMIGSPRTGLPLILEPRE